MRYGTFMMAAVTGSLFLGGAAMASTVTLNVEGLDLEASGPAIASLFTRSDHRMTNGDLAYLHEELNAAGINTKRRLTLLTADTGKGASFISLVDSRWNSNNNTMNRLGLTTSSPDSTDFVINDLGDTWDMTNDANGVSHTATVEFGWRNGRGDGFAWTDLSGDDVMEFEFERLAGNGLRNRNAIQVVTFGASGWEVVDRFDFGDDGTFGFSVGVIPAPGALALLGLAGIVSRRRRR